MSINTDNIYTFIAIFILYLWAFSDTFIEILREERRKRRKEGNESQR